MPRQARTRPVSPAQIRAYLDKAEEYLAAAASEVEAGRAIAATSLAIHAAINAADVVTGVRMGRRAAGQDHDQVLALLHEAGKDGAELETELSRLLPLKSKAEYDPEDIPKGEATRAVERASRCVAVARRLTGRRFRVTGLAVLGSPGILLATLVIGAASIDGRLADGRPHPPGDRSG